ncbi:4102_t:CDS:2, partial [Gigaspora margarita]
AELDRKRNSLVESYREQNLRGESETKRKRNQEPLNKVRLDRVLVKENLEYRLAVAPSEILLDTKDHFKGQFREKCPKIECMTKDWKAVYSPVNEVQEN